jgi:WGR domain-containing protein
MVMGSPLAFRHRANAAPAVWIKWGRIGTNGQELVEEFASEDETGQAEEGVSGSVNSRNALCEERLLSFRFFLRPAAQVASRRREQCR